MIKTLEALIAGMILLASVVILFPPSVIAQSQVPSISYNCLKDLDNKGLLRYYAENFQASELEDSLKSCLPSTLDYKVKICDSSDCNPDSLPNKEVVLSSYVISGDQKSENRLINMWLWFR